MQIMNSRLSSAFWLCLMFFNINQSLFSVDEKAGKPTANEMMFNCIVCPLRANETNYIFRCALKSPFFLFTGSFESKINQYERASPHLFASYALKRQLIILVRGNFLA